MKILHTSDWHLGKSLEDYSRISEQEMFIDELCEICDKHEIELLIIAGDIYDNSNPPATAEKLFYKAITRLSKNGTRKIIVSAGNHDSAARLMAISPLVLDKGIIISGKLNTIVPTGVYPDFEIVNSGIGFFEMKINGVSVVVASMAYPSERNIGGSIFNLDSSENQKEYSEKIKEIIETLEENFREDSINIFIGHFYIIGGAIEKSERDISLGGAYAVSSEILPKKADYIAMGHLHRPQKIGNTKNAFYSGSPIQYDKSEINHPKCVFIADIDKSENKVEKIYLRNYKPIEIWKAESIEEALEICKNNSNKDCYVYLEILCDRVLLQSEFKELKTLKPDIVEIIPILKNTEDEFRYEHKEDKGIEDEFVEFYSLKRGTKPTDEVIKAFLDKVYEEDFS